MSIGGIAWRALRNGLDYLRAAAGWLTALGRNWKYERGGGNGIVSFFY